MPEGYSLQCFMLTHIWRVVWWIFEVGTNRVPISEKMGGRIILKMCVSVVSRCISVRFFDLTTQKPNFSLLAPSARHSLVGERTKNEPFVRKRSWRVLVLKDARQ